MASERASTGELRLRSVSDLLGESFHVPEYQRGYRWTTREVTALLEDLASFQRSAGAPGKHTYYCLQPIIVRRRDDGRWDLVDGQQRLTTIRLIFHTLRELAEHIGKRPFALSYETRPESRAFLENPTEDQANKNIDFHYMFSALQAIQSWFAARDGTDRIDLLNCLTRADDRGPNVRVIWYELDPAEKPEDAFIRLNAGRIPLTSAELIRALLLRADDTLLESRDAQQIAQDWDLLERRLHDDAFWFFLQSSTDPPPTRIGYLFDLFVRLKDGEEEDKALQASADDPLATFLDFQRVLQQAGRTPVLLWREFKRMAQELESWFDDPVLFHLVGYLVATAPSSARDAHSTRRAGAEVLRALLKARRGETRTEFDRHLRWLAWHRFLGTKKLPAATTRLVRRDYEEERGRRLEDLRYGHDGVLRALLLFNIAELLDVVESQRRRERRDADAAARFQFARFKREGWDIEHVRSVADDIPTSPPRRKEWLEHARKFVQKPFVAAGEQETAQRLLEQIDELLHEGIDEAGFKELFVDIRRLSGEGDARDDDDALSNLVLLDQSTNRSYKNAIFPVKRERIIDLDRQGTYLPPATRNVFLKYYAPDAGQLLLWDESDRQAYGEAIRTSLDRFFEPIVVDEHP